jgi:hypothetical protein
MATAFSNAFQPNPAFQTGTVVPVPVPAPIRSFTGGLGGGGFTMFPLTNQPVQPPTLVPPIGSPVRERTLRAAARMAAHLESKVATAARVGIGTKDHLSKGDIAAAELGAAIEDDDD